MKIADIAKLLEDSKYIAITFHTNPDGDALGSTLALLLGLRSLNKRVYVISKDSLPEVYRFLSNSEEIYKGEGHILNNTDCVVALDCGNVDRLSANIDVANVNYKIINIDHHISNDMYGDYNYIDTKASAVGEIIYELLKVMQINLNADIAECLYTSILTDTGSFKHSNTTKNTHRIAGDLIETGIDFSTLYRNIYENKKYNYVKLHGKVINNMELLSNGSICVMELTQKMVESCNCEVSDSSDIIAMGSSIDGVEVTILLKEADFGTKLSLRSKSKVDVRKIAEQFGGGGHVRASGLSLSCGIKDAKEIIINAIEKELI